MMKNFLLVFIGGGFGSGLRYLIGKYLNSKHFLQFLLLLGFVNDIKADLGEWDYWVSMGKNLLVEVQIY